MKCPKCNFENPEGTRFCGNCAVPLHPSEEPQVSYTKTLETPIEELKRGTTFADRYEIIEELGKGGMGKVYRVEDKKIKEEVALKLIKPEIASDKKTIERFSNELKMARKIAHRNVCKMYELMEDEGTHFITMEYVEGQDLRGLIRQTGQLAVGTAIRIAKQVCEGLSEAHRLGVVHRDLKPSNIMIDKEGNARIMDFGIARSLKTKGITGAGVMIGTPEYMSPEQVEGKEADQRSDIYSLGVILYEMVTGRVPFEGDTTLSVAVKHKTETPKNPKEYNEQISDVLSQVILRCLEKDKERRCQSAGELRSELKRIEQGMPTTEREIPKRKPITSKEITVTFGLKKLFIPALVVIFVMITAVVIWQLLPKKGAAPFPEGKSSIAILPFDDLSPQKDQEHLCEGLAESIINALSKIKDLRVPARTSSFSFKGKEGNIKEIGERLNVKTVLTGSMQKSGNRIRITAQLINITDESLLWSEQFNRELHDVFTIQDEISLAIVDNLKIKLLGEEKLQLTRRFTENPEAYNLYLQGKYFLELRGEENLLMAINYFEEAVKKDPGYALAFADLSYTYSTVADWGFLSSKVAFSKGKDAAIKALELDDSLAEAHNALALIKVLFEWDFQNAEKEFKRALELNPNYATVHQEYAELFIKLGRYDKALSEIKLAQDHDPLSLFKRSYEGVILNYARQYDQAIDVLKRVLDMDPEYRPAKLYLGRSYQGKEMYEEALSLFKEIDNKLGIARTYAEMGKVHEARQILEEMIKSSEETYISPLSIATIYIEMGDTEQGLGWIEKGYEEYDPGISTLLVSPGFDSVRSDPRFINILKKIGLEE